MSIALEIGFDQTVAHALSRNRRRFVVRID
jgi:hypothetical protein